MNNIKIKEELLSKVATDFIGLKMPPRNRQGICQIETEKPFGIGMER